MRSVSRTRFLLGFLLAMVVGVSTFLLVSHGPGGGTGGATGTGSAALAGSAAPFSIEGKATEPISPGVGASLNLKLTNPNDVPISVTDLTVTVQKIRAPKADGARPCTVRDFTVKQGSSSAGITLAARASSTLSNLGLPRTAWPEVRLLERAVDQDGCKGATLALEFAASGTREQR
ncbi:MAG: hypothetical protein QOF35_1485 [Actinomycetota bacterium]|jgi:hypothetical protein|nr:hypothetical protein [Actinomycetota bacterium]